MSEESMKNASNHTEWVGNNEDDPTFIFFTFILHGIITNTVGFIGLIGNIICIMVLRRPQMRGNSTNVILSALSAFDAFLIVTSMLMLGFPAIGRYSDDVISEYYYTQIYPYIMPCVYAFGLIAQTGSIYCTLGVTVERYIVICWPLRSSNICTYGRAKMAVILIALFSLVYNIPRFFEVTWDTPSSKDETSTSNTSISDVNVTHTMNGSNPYLSYHNSSNYEEEISENVIPTPTALRVNAIYISVYVTWMYFVFMFVLPFGCLSVLNLLIYLDVRRSNARVSTLSQHEKKELRLAVMLMTVVVVFQICNIPPLLVNILEVSGASEIPELTQTSNLLVTVNSSVNIFIYIILGDKFKRVFLQCLSENMSCCYGGGGLDNKVCCPLITCGRKLGSKERNGGITGTTDFYMTDALITQPSRTPSRTIYVNASKPHSTRPSMSGLNPSNLHDTHSNKSASLISNERSTSLGQPTESTQTDEYSNPPRQNKEENSPLVIVSQDRPVPTLLVESTVVKTGKLHGDNEKDKSTIKESAHENKNNNDLPKIVLEDSEENDDYEDEHLTSRYCEKESNEGVKPISDGKIGTSQLTDLNEYTLKCALAPKASCETLESSSCCPSPIPVRYGEKISGSHLHNQVLDHTETENDTTLTRLRQRSMDFDNKGFTLKKENNQEELGERDCKNETTSEVSDNKFSDERSPFLQQNDSEENNDVDNYNHHCSTLTTNVIAKISNSPTTSKKLRDV